MIDFSDTIDAITVCETCDGLLGRGRYVHVEAAILYNFCSAECFRAAEREQRQARWATRRHHAKQVAIGLVFLAAWLAPHQGPQRHPLPRVDPTVAERAARSSDLAPLPPGWFGPEWPPTETSLLAALGQDTWIHPLAGPFRRMPRTDARVFGAVRPGDRAIECRNGHCGVDLGGEIWGEHVHAVHDGVVDFAQRGLNPDHGGRFVRISHRNGTVFTMYFHLAAIPRGIERGVRVKGGDVVGLLGDTGVKQSAPHLHFSISIRPAKDWPEKYIDPEPLIALWPLRTPLDGSEVGLVTTLAQVGAPLGSAPLKSGRNRKAAAKSKRAPDDSVDDDRSGSTRRPTDPTEDEAPSETAGPEPSMEE